MLRGPFKINPPLPPLLFNFKTSTPHYHLFPFHSCSPPQPIPSLLLPIPSPLPYPPHFPPPHTLFLCLSPHLILQLPFTLLYCIFVYSQTWVTRRIYNKPIRYIYLLIPTLPHVPSPFLHLPTSFPSPPIPPLIPPATFPPPPHL